jgi:hypothetical protein
LDIPPIIVLTAYIVTPPTSGFQLGVNEIGSGIRFVE